MIVEAFKESLELGLAKPGQVVVSGPTYCYFVPVQNDDNSR